MNTNNMNLEASKYEEQINNKNESFSAALDDFKKNYVNYNKSPENQDFNENYMQSRGQLQTLSNDMFTLTKTIRDKIEEKSKGLAVITNKLAKEKEIAKQLEPVINNLNGVKAGSAIMIDDSKTDYKFNYYKNVELFMGILILLALLVSPKAALMIFAIFVIYKLSIFQQIMKILGKIF
jgi:galactitol-specific phosphotransferase system IIB component